MAPSEEQGQTEPTQEVVAFYDGLAGSYHLIYADWEGAVARQAAVLAKVIRGRSQAADPHLLDCSCGIGTQALGLAVCGFDVTATDISPHAVERCQREADDRGIKVSTQVVDMRHLADAMDGRFDVVLSCDNAVPHLLGKWDLLAALRGMHARLVPGGLVVIGLRDYEQLRQQRSQSTPIRVFDGGERLVFQVWDWEESGEIYGLRHFLVQRREGVWHTQCRQARYRALTRAELTAALDASGFVETEWHRPTESGHFELLVTALRDSSS
ncbi:MAG: class I SAM-dependent methyltransferase [bacterium]|nr:class I SAM-dependent methyltransferase [bacterium]